MASPRKIFQKSELLKALQQTGWNQTNTALMLGCCRSTVKRNMRELDLESPPVITDSDEYDDTNLTRLKKLLKRRRWSLVELADEMDTAPYNITEALTALNENHILVDNHNGFSLGTSPQEPDAPMVIDFKKYAEKEYCIGVTADNHIGSKYERMDVLESLFDRFADRGVEQVYQCGNIIDGECRFNKYDIYVHGVEGQVENLIDKWPQRKGIKTDFITGDCHEGWWIARENLNIGQKIEDEAKRAGRDDLRFRGHLECDIKYEQKGGSSVIRLVHPGGGTPYAVSYPSQKYVESLQGGEKPNLILGGHHHKYNHGYPREVHYIESLCTQDQTPFMRKKKIQAIVGGLILWIKQNEIGIFTSVKIEPLFYFDKKFYEHKW